MIDIHWHDTSGVQLSTITRDEIDAETNVPLLMEWFEAFDARIIEQKSFYDTWQEMDWDEEAKKRFAGKLAFARMGKSWIMRRLRQLDHDPRGKLERDMVNAQRRVEKISVAARKVIKQRDVHAETGVYPFPMENDQAFDDWAADVLEEALPNSLATDQVT